MQLSVLKQTLDKLDKLKFQLPNGEFVPAHFHITEVGNVTRNYIDCGGTLRHENKINLQLWVASDVDHRLNPRTVLDILQLAEKQLDCSNMEVEVDTNKAPLDDMNWLLMELCFSLSIPRRLAWLPTNVVCHRKNLVCVSLQMV